MARERSVQAFILKRQDYGEADQIITLFSKEEGKLRALVKAAKLPTSKLQPVLQPLFETRVTLTGTSGSPGLSKVIGAQLVKAYSSIFESESKLAAWYMASELIIKSLPDSAPNDLLYTELEQYALFLHENDLDAVQVKHSSTQFQIKSLVTLGLGIDLLPQQRAGEQIWFSIDRGGFSTQNAGDSLAISAQTYGIFLNMARNNYAPIGNNEEAAIAPLYTLVNRFVSYQLEREIKSQQFLSNA